MEGIMKKGEKFIVTTGEYSDYGIRDSFVVLKTFSFDAALRRWLEKHGNDGEFAYGHGEQEFLTSLRADGFVADDAFKRDSSLRLLASRNESGGR
jgi:hypothetical protein